VTDADQMLDTVNGNHIHQNDGMHLMGGISDDAEWKDYWRHLLVFLSKAYDIPSGAIGKQFIIMVKALLKGIKTWKWNTYRFIVFQMTVLQHMQDVKDSWDIKRQITRHKNAWEEGKLV
jgi:hypothetical protein